VGGASSDALTSFAAAAVQTERIVMGTSITPTYPRHPIVLASQAIALEGLMPGRLELGIGTSHKPTIEGSFGIPMGKPLTHLREYLTILRALLWEGSADFQGEYFNVKANLPDGTVPSNTPISISALRKNAFNLAGELADAAITWVTPLPYIAETALPNLQAGADRAGRARPRLIAHVPVAVSTDRPAVADAFRNQFPAYSKLPFYQNMFADAGYPVTPQRTMTDELVDILAVSGTPDEIRQRLESIRGEGIDELLISHVIVNDAAKELEALSAILAG
jgi:alkanesulfonate monooxygenase SsuD/methylene tetrahydromethanopterin reductase-like flavin-dependent oxidoreductase (luciferase family)